MGSYKPPYVADALAPRDDSRLSQHLSSELRDDNGPSARCGYRTEASTLRCLISNEVREHPSTIAAAFQGRKRQRIPYALAISRIYCVTCPWW